MRQIGTQSSRYFRKIVTFVLAFAMVVTSLAVSSTDSQAAKKVKKVSIGVKVGSSGILVLKKGQKKKLKVSVTPKKASKKVTYKSSKSSVVSVDSKGVVKALKSKGSAKITVTSQQNKKKKATIKVKIGTPIKKVSINKKALCTWSSANWELKMKNGQLQKVYPSYKKTLTASKGTFEVMAGRVITLKTTTSPKKATYRKYRWASSKSSVAMIPEAFKVGTSCKITTKKQGTATITATAMDGSGKKAKVKLKVTPFKSDLTPAPTATPDPRKSTMIEDFESYDVGTVWTKYTSRGKNAGTMTVVQDPENPENKCLKVDMNGTEAAYDFAPVFNVDLSKLKDSDGNPTAGRTLKNYSTIKADWRVIGNDSDVTYKKIYAYFDQFEAIKPSDAFATNDNKTASAHGVEKELRFGVEIPMAEGADKESGITLANGNASKENGKYMPTYHDSHWKMEDPTSHYSLNSCTLGFKMKEEDDIKVGFATRNLVFNTARINEADATLLDQSKFDVVMGSTYKGDAVLKEGGGGLKVFYYVDNVALVEEDIPITGFELGFSEGGDKVYPGGDTKVNVTYTPQETTQKELNWTSNNPQVTVNSEGKVIVPEDFDFGGQQEVPVVITATSKSNPALTKSVTVTVCQIELPTEPYVIDFETMYDAELSGDLNFEKTTDPDGEECWKFNFTDKNQRIYFKLPEEVNLSAYQKYEIIGFVPEQMSLDIYDAKLPDSMADENAEWWKTAAAKTYPFFGASRSERDPDGTPQGVNAKEKEAELLSSIKQSDDTSGNYNAVKYIAIGTASGEGYSDAGPYYIYSFKLTPRPQGDLPKFTFSTLPIEESFEGEGTALFGLEKSTVKEATAEAPAQDGEHYMEVSAEDNPTILIDNREGTENANYTVSAWVKAKDPAESGEVTFLSGLQYKDAKYDQYEGYEHVTALIRNQTTSADLSSADGWVEIKGSIRVAAGKISELNIGCTEDTKYAFLLDNVKVEPK